VSSGRLFSWQHGGLNSSLATAPPNHRVEIEILGPMTIRVDGRVHSVSATQERAVLALLTIRAERVVSVPEISRALWGDDEPKTAGKAIQGYISKLRRLLPEGTIQTVPPGYRAMIDPEKVDALRFEKLVRSARERYEGDPETYAKSMSAALELWSGPALLDLCDNDLGRNEATRLWELRLTTEEQRFDALLECGQHRELIAELMAAVDAEPLREQRWALLMLALYRCGRQGEALRTFRRLSYYLATELGIEPSTAVSSLELSILQNDPHLDWVPMREAAGTFQPGSIQASEVSASMPLSRRLSVLPAVRLIGRTEELGTIEDALKRVATSEHPGLVLIRGEPGSGKTALLGAAARHAVEGGAYVLFGHCEEDLVVPYQLFSESLGHYFTHADPRQFSDYVTTHCSELPRLVPSLERISRPGSRSRTIPTDNERAILFNEVVGLLTTISRFQPVVLAFDDLQWADPASLQLMRHLVAAEQSMRLLVVATYREGASFQDGPLLGMLALLRTRLEVDRVEVADLDSDGVVAYMEAAIGHPLDAPLMHLAEEIHLETNGNPFFVSEMVRHLAEDGTIRRDDTGRWIMLHPLRENSLPASVNEVIRARVMRLGDAAQDILSLAATIGRDFDLDLLTRAASASVDDALNVLDAAESHSLVREFTTAPGQYSFVHALIQHTLYENLGPTRKARAHESVAQALEGLEETPGSRLGELARHWFSTGRKRDLPKALSYAHQAADAALACLAPADALRYYTQALEICDLVGDVDSGIKLDLAIGLGIAQRGVGIPAYRETLLTAARRANACGDTDRLVTAALAQERFWMTADTVDSDRVEVLESALARVTSVDPRRAVLLAVLCQELVHWSPYDHRRQLADEALFIADHCGEDEVLARVLVLISYSLLVPQTVDELRGRSADLLAIAERVGDAELTFWATSQLLMLATCVADIDEMDRTFDLLEQQASELNLPNTSWTFTWISAARALTLGEFERAVTLANRALEIGVEMSEPDAMANFNAQFMNVSLQRGSLHEIIPLIEAVAADISNLPVFVAALCLAYVETDQTNRASELLHEFASRGFQLPLDPLWLTGMICYAEAAAHCRDDAAAQAVFAQLAPWKSQWVYSGLTSGGPVSHVLGELAAALGNYNQAHEYFRESAAMCGRLRAAFSAARTELAWGKMLVARNSPGDREEARRLFGSAASTARKRGYRVVEDRASLALSRMGRLNDPRSSCNAAVPRSE
jgi:DNA-binding SARP family transcriptional activator/tetratricopeptide (TPR) repeat protein